MTLDPASPTDYDIITAMRGPDVGGHGSDLLKVVTAAVIRNFVGVSRGIPAAIFPADCAVIDWHGDFSTEEERKAAREMWQKNWHYRAHIKRGFEGLIRKEVPGAKEHWDWLKETLGMS